MSVFELHKAALAPIIASHAVTDAFVLDGEICARMAKLTDPRGSKPLAELEPRPSHTVLRLCCAGDGIDRVAVVEGQSARLIQVTDIVTYDDELSPLQLVEYRFSADDDWHVSHICEETLGFLKQTKHKAWRDSMLNVFGNCAKAFIPSLKQGLITHMFDHQMFVDDSPAGAAYIIINDKGEKVHVPHPVHEFRVWNSASAGYACVSALLDGVPESKESQQKYWQEFLAELRQAMSQKFGVDFIDDCLNMEAEEIKTKYGA